MMQALAKEGQIHLAIGNGYSFHISEAKLQVCDMILCSQLRTHFHHALGVVHGNHA